MPCRHVQPLAVHFRQPLGGAHHRARIHRLVGGDQHHQRRPARRRRIGHRAGAEHVGLQALQRVGLDDRHMFQRRGVEHEFGLERVAEFFEPGAVAHIGDHGAARHVRRQLGDFQIDLPERVFAVVQQHQLRRREPRELPRQFRADAAARPGDQHAPAGDQPRHAGTVQLHLLAVQQILDGDRLQFDFLVRRGEAGEAGGAQHADAGALRRRQQRAERVARQLRRGDDQQVRLLRQPVQRRLGLLDRAENIQPLHAPADMAWRRAPSARPRGRGRRRAGNRR